MNEASLSKTLVDYVLRLADPEAGVCQGAEQVATLLSETDRLTADVRRALSVQDGAIENLERMLTEYHSLSAALSASDCSRPLADADVERAASILDLHGLPQRP